MKLNTYKNKYFTLSKNKTLEFQLSRWEESPLFGFTWSLRRKVDHPGFSIYLTLFGYEFSVEYYDVRHWDEIQKR